MSVFDATNDPYADLYEAQQQAIEYTESGNKGKWQGIYVSPLPSGCPPFVKKVAEGKHAYDFIPWVVQGAHPNNIPPGKMSYIVAYYRHEKVGPKEAYLMCLQKTFGRPCPLCEWREAERMKDKMNKTLYDQWNPKWRAMYNLWIHSTPEEEAKGIQILDCSYYMLETDLAKRCQKPVFAGSGGGTIPYMHPVKGSIVYFERVGTGATSTKYMNHQFLDRQAPIPQYILDKAFPLETLLRVPTYEEIWEEVYQKPFEGQPGKVYSLPDPVAALTTAPAATQQQPATAATTQQAPSSGFVMPGSEPVATATAVLKCPNGGIFGIDTDAPLLIQLCKSCNIWKECATEKVKSGGTQSQAPKAEPVVTQQPVQQQAAPAETPSTPAETPSTPTETASSTGVVARRRRR